MRFGVNNFLRLVGMPSILNDADAQNTPTYQGEIITARIKARRLGNNGFKIPIATCVISSIITKQPPSTMSQ